jgi:hypothetical protein
MERALGESVELTRLAMPAGRMFAFDWNPSTDEVRRSHDAAAIIGFAGDATQEAGRDSVKRVHPEDREHLIRTVTSLPPANDLRCSRRWEGVVHTPNSEQVLKPCRNRSASTYRVHPELSLTRYCPHNP